MKTIKIMFFLNGRIFEIHLKHIVVEGVAGCVRRRKRYQQNIKNESKHRYKIDVKTILKQVMPK